MTATRHTGAPHSRQDTLIGMRNCLEFLAQEAKTQELTLTQWLLRMAIASLEEELVGTDVKPDLVPAAPAPTDAPTQASEGSPKRPRSVAD